MNIKVKPLVWHQVGEKLHWVCKNTLSGHEASIKVYAGADYFDLYSYGPRGPSNRFSSLADAKAAAQAHHEARILSTVDVGATEAAIRADERAKVLGEAISLMDTQKFWNDALHEKLCEVGKDVTAARSARIKSGLMLSAMHELFALHTPESSAIAEREA